MPSGGVHPIAYVIGIGAVGQPSEHIVAVAEILHRAAGPALDGGELAGQHLEGVGGADAIARGLGIQRLMCRATCGCIIF